LFGTATAFLVRLPQLTGAAPQLLQLIPYVVRVLALVAVGVRKTRAKPARGLALRALTSPSARGVSHTRRMAAGPKR